jgi:hypothetical protein
LSAAAEHIDHLIGYRIKGMPRTGRLDHGKIITEPFWSFATISASSGHATALPRVL